jgi:hypothetical protein
MPNAETTVKMVYKDPDSSLYSSPATSTIASLKRNNKRLIEQMYHTQGQMADVARLVCPFTGYDSCDATYPYIQDFYIPTDTIELISVRVYYKIRAFRAYSKATQSNAQQTSSSGGGTTTSSGGGTTTSSGGGTEVTSASGGSSTPTSSSYDHGTITSAASAASIRGVSATMVHSVTNVGDESASGTLLGGTVDRPYLSDPNHYHSVSVGSHSHTVSISAHTHTVTISAHTHTVDGHTHTVDGHTHTVDGHTHDVTFGIYEKIPSAPSVKVWLSQNGVDFPLFIGESTEDSDFEIATQIKGTGWKGIKFEVNELMQIVSNIIIVADIQVTN